MAAPAVPRRVSRRHSGPARRHRHAAGSMPSARRRRHRARERSPAGSIPDSTRVVSFVARSLDRLRGFDRFLTRSPMPCSAPEPTWCRRRRRPDRPPRAGRRVPQPGLPRTSSWQRSPPVDPERSGSWGGRSAVVAEVLAASDLHVAPGRPYPVARSLLEAMAAGCVVLASDTEPAPRGHQRRGDRAPGRRRGCRCAVRSGACRAGRPGRPPAAGRRRVAAGAVAIKPGVACPGSPSSLDAGRQRGRS